MIKYKLNNNVAISLNTDNPNQKVPILIEGDTVKVREIVTWLSNQNGAFGHLIGSATTPIDLHACLNKQTTYKYTLEAGKNIVNDYDPQLPPDAHT